MSEHGPLESSNVWSPTTCESVARGKVRSFAGGEGGGGKEVAMVGKRRGGGWRGEEVLDDATLSGPGRIFLS